MIKRKKYSGVVVPMMTPFMADKTVDESAVATLTTHVINHGCLPFVLGTTGEAVSISKSQRIKVVNATMQAVNGKCAVYAGISGNSLQDAIEEGNFYADAGVDVLVSTMPSYYPVDESQMVHYFSSLADALKKPLIIYNIPATTHLSIPVSVVVSLSKHPNIIGFKDSEKSESRIDELTELFKDNEGFSYFMGWALMSQTALQKGADGIIPSSGNIAPAVYRKLYEAVLQNDNEISSIAQAKGEAISAFYQKGRILSHSLSAFKAMLAAYKLCQPYVLPPLYQLEDEKIYQQLAIETFGLLDEINSL